MKKFIEFILEIFNTKSYKWIKSEFTFRTQAYFKTKSNKEYYLCIDEISPNVYNIHFYYEKDGNKIITLDKSGDEYEVLGNIKNAIYDFIYSNEYRSEYLEFIGYSSFESERNALYVMFLKHISSNNFISYWKKIGNNYYYFLKSKSLPDDIINRYEEMFIKYDKKNKYY